MDSQVTLVISEWACVCWAQLEQQRTTFLIHVIDGKGCGHDYWKQGHTVTGSAGSTPGSLAPIRPFLCGLSWLASVLLSLTKWTKN